MDTLSTQALEKANVVIQNQLLMTGGDGVAGQQRFHPSVHDCIAMLSRSAGITIVLEPWRRSCGDSVCVTRMDLTGSVRPD